MRKLSNKLVCGRVSRLAQLALASLALCGWSAAQVKASPQTLFAQGQKVTGAEHPEMFSRRVAFEMLLTVLAIDSQDAPHLQRRARMLETKQIGLGTEDASALEQIVEGYRVGRDMLNAQALQTKNNTVLTATGSPTDLNRRRKLLLQQTLVTMNTRLSSPAKQQINAYLDHIISQSELHPSSSTGVQ